MRDFFDILVTVFIFVLCVSFSSGCEQTPEDRYRDSIDGFYYQDPRTNLCFLRIDDRPSFYQIGLTNVPCTPEVLKLIEPSEKTSCQ